MLLVVYKCPFPFLTNRILACLCFGAALNLEQNAYRITCTWKWIITVLAARKLLEVTGKVSKETYQVSVSGFYLGFLSLPLDVQNCLNPEGESHEEITEEQKYK